MQKGFLHSIQQVPDYQNKKFLIAISGGLDSMVLAYLFQRAKLHFALAHCNFKLRGQESDDDQKFVTDWADKNKISLYINVCDLGKSSEKNTQIAARNARYDWFFQLRKENNFDYIVTAHHLDDSIETFFINLQRATGIKGLLGIQNSQDIIRPLQHFTRKEIMQFAQKQNIVWREDSSNASDKYKRNFIRHQIIPKFEEITPNFKQSVQKTLQYLQQSNAIIDTWLKAQIKEIISQKDKENFIDIKKLEQLPQKELFLHHYLSAFGFSDWKAVNNLSKAQNGKAIYAENYRLLKHQDKLCLCPLTDKEEEIYEFDFQPAISKPISLSMQVIDSENISISRIKQAEKNEIYVDYDLIDFPIKLRKKQAGDYFYPLGMKGKMKLSDYFINQKISLVEKEKIWLLCNGKNIVWIVGHRADNRYKITTQTKKVLHIKLTSL